jgi:hypothetical protein
MARARSAGTSAPATRAGRATSAKRLHPELALAAICLVVGVAMSGDLIHASQGAPDLAPVRRVVDDYIGLYTKERLSDWKALFLPSFTATYTNADGTVSTRTLEEFYESQRAGFAKGAMSETLHDLRLTREGRLAHAFAGFDFTSGGNTRRGQLMLLLIEEKGQFRIAALAFSYHLQ